MFLPLCLTLGACSSSSDEEGESSNGSNSQESKNFLGYWHSENEDYDFLFNEDGSCIAYANWDAAPESGRWSYDEKSKTLTSTIGGNSWLINSSSSYSWTGINMGSYRTVSYYHSDIHYLWRSCLTRYKWNQVDGSDSFSFSFDQVDGASDSYIYLFGNYGDYYYNDMSFVMGFWEIKEVTYNLPNYYTYDGFEVYPQSAKMKIYNCMLDDDKFTATFDQTVEYVLSILYHYNPKNIEQDVYEQTNKSTGMAMTVTDFGKSSPILTIEDAKTGYKATYKGTKK